MHTGCVGAGDGHRGVDRVGVFLTAGCGVNGVGLIIVVAASSESEEGKKK
jgi:hypothetical protein